MKSLVAVAVHPHGGSPASRRSLVRLLSIALVALLLSGLFAVWAGPLAAPVAAATGDWSQFHNDPVHSGYNATDTTISAANVGALGVAWTATTGTSIISSPAVADDVVYVGSFDHKLYAYAVGCASGGGSCSPLWTATTGSYIDSSPAVADGVVYVGSEDGKLYAYTVGCNSGGGSCSPLWTATTSGSIDSSPAVANGVVYVGSGDHKLYAYAVGCNSGGGSCSPLWTATTGGSIYFSSPAVANGVVYVGSEDHKLYAYAVGCASGGGTCSPLWTATTGDVIYSSPAVANGVVYVGSEDRKLYAYAVGCASGGGSCSPLWTATTGIYGDVIFSSPAVANGVVYVGSSDGKLYAYAVGCASGGGSCSPLWTATTGSYIDSSPAVANGVVYVGSADGKLYAYVLNPLNHLILSPASATVTAGGSQAYTATGFDAGGHSMGDVTSATTFTIAGGGSCTGTSCTSNVPGDHTVTGTDGTATGTATLHVNGPLDHLVLSPSSATITAGGSRAYVAEGFDAYKNDLGDVTGGTTFTIAGGGSCTGTSCTSTVPGDHTVTGTDGTASGTTTLHVNAGALNHLLLSPASTSITAGGSQAYTAEGFDAYNNDLGDVTSATTFTIDSGTACPSHSCSATLAGDHRVRGIDSTATGTATLHVNAGSLDHLVLNPASATITAGDGQAYTAVGYDHYNNSLGDVTSATTFTIEGTACPADTCSAILAGDHTVTGTDGTASGTTTLHVNAGALNHLLLSPASTSITAGGSQAYTAEGFDAYNNDLGDVTGGTTFTIDSGTACPADTCSAILAGDHTVTGTDGTASGTTTLHVNAGAATTLVVAGLTTPRTAGIAGTITVTARDAYGNTAPIYSGTVHFTSTDGAAILPANSTLTAGVGTFSVTLKTAGSRSVTATDTLTPSITGTQSGISVTPAAATTLVVAGLTTPRTAGVAGSVTVTARDAYGNTATAYAGTVHFTSTDTQAVLPANATLTSGVGTFGVTLKTAGSRSVTATDTVTPSITGTQAGIVINPAAATTLVLSGLTTPRTAGVAGTLTVTAKDAYGNTATGYLGTVHFTSTDAKAVLPANYTFIAANAGVHAFSVTLKTAGTQSVTATDTVTASITGLESGIVVTPGVTFVSLPNPAPRGGVAHLTARTSVGAKCTIVVIWPSGNKSAASGLATSPIAGADGIVSWDWNVAATTKPGTATATVTCTLNGASGQGVAQFSVS